MYLRPRRICRRESKVEGSRGGKGALETGSWHARKESVRQAAGLRGDKILKVGFQHTPALPPSVCCHPAPQPAW